jgi:hypothetical protein
MNFLSLSLFVLELSNVLAKFMDIIDAEVIGYIENEERSNNSVCNCGRGLKNPKILNGENATQLEYPWQVWLKVHYHFAGTFSCGGSLISRKHILSAAHCVRKTHRV